MLGDVNGHTTQLHACFDKTLYMGKDAIGKFMSLEGIPTGKDENAGLK